MTGSPTFNFVRIFAAHRECCSRLLELSRNQDRLINEDDYTQLLVVLGKKQKVLNQMEEYAKHRPRIQALWKMQRDELDSETRQQCEDLLTGTESDLAELVRRHRRRPDVVNRRRPRKRLARPLERRDRILKRRRLRARGSGPMTTIMIRK